MAEDIVTRLQWFTCEELNCESDFICREAADEIERLRAEVTRWKELAADLAMQCAINEMQGGDA
jgi:hypothetical protein